MLSRTIKMALLAGLFVLVAAGIATAAVTLAGGSPASPGVVDVKGPCDEAEHVNDPECAGPQVPEDDPTPGLDDLLTPGDDDGPGDISGPCDEAENANDPRCTGASPAPGDNSGPSANSGPSGNSGPSENSGPGNADDDDDDSGPSGDDDEDDDRSGSNSGEG